MPSSRALNRNRALEEKVLSRSYSLKSIAYIQGNSPTAAILPPIIRSELALPHLMLINLMFRWLLTWSRLLNGGMTGEVATFTPMMSSGGEIGFAVVVEVVVVTIGTALSGQQTRWIWLESLSQNKRSTNCLTFDIHFDRIHGLKCKFDQLPKAFLRSSARLQQTNRIGRARCTSTT